MRRAVQRLKWTVSDTLMRTRWMDLLEHVGLFFRKMLSLFPVWNICYLLETSSHTKACFSYLGPTGTDCSRGQRSTLVELNAYFYSKTPLFPVRKKAFSWTTDRDLISISLLEQYLSPKATNRCFVKSNEHNAISSFSFRTCVIPFQRAVWVSTNSAPSQ